MLLINFKVKTKQLHRVKTKQHFHCLIDISRKEKMAFVWLHTKMPGEGHGVLREASGVECILDSNQEKTEDHWRVFYKKEVSDSLQNVIETEDNWRLWKYLTKDNVLHWQEKCSPVRGWDLQKANSFVAPVPLCDIPFNCRLDSYYEGGHCYH